MSAIASYLGADVGTSGVRALAIDDAGTVLATARVALSAPNTGKGGVQEQAPELWWQALRATLKRLAHDLPAAAQARSLALDGTSGTLLLSDDAGHPLGPALLYADYRASAEAERIAALAPAQSGAQGASSALAKLLWLLDHGGTGAAHALHQSDWLYARLGAAWGVSDENNALKLGYDPVARHWPEWLDSLGVPMAMLPRVVEPGTPIGRIDATRADELGLPTDLLLAAGTTDSVAGFLATGADTPGDGVTSLGSTLTLKLASRRPVFVPEAGIYSHRLGEQWLAGGTSNTGGAVLRAFFSDAEIARYSQELDPDRPTGLDYYPLLRPGERFPIADPQRPPTLTPRPADPRVFFQAILEGIAEIERQGYTRLSSAGADPLRRIRSVGGGAANRRWALMRRSLLGVPEASAAHHEAAYGAALLARRAARDALP